MSEKTLTSNAGEESYTYTRMYIHTHTRTHTEGSCLSPALLPLIYINEYYISIYPKIYTYYK
jgi:hypothetical protein